MKPKDSADGTSRRGQNYAKNLRPATSTRGTFALGLEALEQADRLARIASNYQAGGVSRSAVIRGLLKFAEEIALQSGDPAVATILAASPPPESGTLPKIGKSNPDQARLWQAIRTGILAS